MHVRACLQVHASVREMEGNLENMALSQQNANEGIFLLCKWVLHPYLKYACQGLVENAGEDKSCRWVILRERLSSLAWSLEALREAWSGCAGW